MRAGLATNCVGSSISFFDFLLFLFLPFNLGPSRSVPGTELQKTTSFVLFKSNPTYFFSGGGLLYDTNDSSSLDPRLLVPLQASLPISF